MRIYLVGFMGAGKTTVGRCLARRMSCPFVDLDSEIERLSNRPLPEIFEDEGETGFRTRESAALRLLSQRDRVVVATGGGTLTRPENRDVIRSTGRSVFLRVDLEVLFERVERSPRVRPLFRDRDQARALYEERLPAYLSADLVVPVDTDDDAEGVADRILKRLRSDRCAT